MAHECGSCGKPYNYLIGCPCGRKHFAVFAGEEGNTLGGWSDFCEVFETVDEAASYARKHMLEEGYDWWHVVDLYQMTIVSEG